MINFESNSYPIDDNVCTNCVTLIDPNSLIPPSATLALIITSNDLRLSANLFAFSISFSSFCCCCLKFSSNTLIADLVAKIAYPLGIR